MIGALFALLVFANQNISPACAVTGGEPVKPHEFPFLATFYQRERGREKWLGAGGALISPRHVVTMKHGFVDHAKKNDPIEVGFGKTVRANDEGVVKRQVSHWVFHPTIDLAIAILNEDVPLSEHIKTIGLPEAGDDFTGQNATLAGAGMLGHNISAPPRSSHNPEDYLSKVTLKVGSEPGQRCPDQRHLCATSLRKDPWGSGCSGDSGSPLFICNSVDSCIVLAVIVSGPPYMTQGNCQGDSWGPSMAALRPWIAEVVKVSVVPKQKGP